jgi:methylmalonyl-CoA/ethylmalonyl-CoA epimerase
MQYYGIPFSEGSDGVTAQVRYIDHVGIVVANADTSAQDLSEMLGVHVVHDEIIDAVGVRLLYLAVSDAPEQATVQLVQPVAPGPIRDFLTMHGQGPHHVCFAVDQIAAFLSRPSESESKVFTGGHGRQACFLAAKPAGLQVELIELGAQAPLSEPG